MERPIIFSGPMVRAILDGRKTQTRRIVRFPSWFPVGEELKRDTCEDYCGLRTVSCDIGTRADLPAPVNTGDVLWVRETWGCPSADHPRCPDGRKPQEGDSIVYRAKHADDWQWSRCESVAFAWRPSIHMPRWACRLRLKVTGVRVERLQDISEEDAEAEGVQRFETMDGSRWWENGVDDTRYTCPIECFCYLWESINGDGSWDVNPWDWVYEFERMAQ